MSLSNSAETSVLEQIFKGTALPWNANTDLWIALYTADPGEAGTAVTNEAAYGSYARVPVSRSTGLTVTGNQLTNAALVQFPQSTSAGSDVTHFGIVTTSSGAGTLIAKGALSTAVPTSVGIQPQFAASALVATID